ncbi:cupredoxin domain-containing protein [Bacillus sp. JJ1533]|uniref:cupredoxin domain-containing protein n=1 Tax=Bacillus sp. JJ1533 TaxID=3122959 RepID=UPI002FFF9C4D
MSLFYNFVIITVIACTVLAVFFSFLLKNRLSNMHSMVLSMAMGMNVGLVVGVLFGSLYQGNLYYSTILSVAIGTLAGLACGLSLGLLPIVEGFMSGLMGGMMGAMLGDMITLEQADVLINILLTLTICSLFLFLILPSSLGKENRIEKRSWFLKPILTFAFIITLLYFGNQLDKNTKISKTESSTGTSHNNHENHGGTTVNNSSEITINVNSSTFSYTPSKIIIKKNQPVILTLKNNDAIEHDIEIKEIPIHSQTEQNHSEHSHGEADLHLHTTENSSSVIHFTPLKEGIYKFYCTIPGHAKNGMIGELVVLN